MKIPVSWLLALYTDKLDLKVIPAVNWTFLALVSFQSTCGLYNWQRLSVFTGDSVDSEVDSQIWSYRDDGCVLLTDVLCGYVSIDNGVCWISLRCFTDSGTQSVASEHRVWREKEGMQTGSVW